MSTVPVVSLDTPEQIDAEATLLALGSPGFTVAGATVNPVDVFRERVPQHLSATGAAYIRWRLIVHQPRCEYTAAADCSGGCVFFPHLLHPPVDGLQCTGKHFDSPRRAVLVAARLVQMMGVSR